MNISARNLRYAFSIGLATAILALVLTYVLGAPVLLQTPQAEEGHKLFMSIYVPLIQGITGGHSSISQIHGGPASEEQQSTMQRMPHPQMQGMNSGTLGKNMLGSPEGMAAAGFAAVVLMVVILLAAAAYIVSWKQRSFLVPGLLATSGIILMILPLANMNFVIPGPIIGFIVGLGIVGIGVAKGIRMARAVTVAPR